MSAGAGNRPSLLKGNRSAEEFVKHEKRGADLYNKYEEYYGYVIYIGKKIWKLRQVRVKVGSGPARHENAKTHRTPKSGCFDNSVQIRVR